jgi:hypothetical protein
MDNSKTPKIVVGVALVAAYGAGLAFLALRDRHETVVAQNSADLPAALSSAPTPPLEPAAALPDTPITVADDSATMVSAAAPAARVAAPGSRAPSSRSDSMAARVRDSEQMSLGQMSPGATRSQPAQESAETTSDAASDAGSAPGASSADAPPSVPDSLSPLNDSEPAGAAAAPAGGGSTADSGG